MKIIKTISIFAAFMLCASCQMTKEPYGKYRTVDNFANLGNSLYYITVEYPSSELLVLLHGNVDCNYPGFTRSVDNGGLTFEWVSDYCWLATIDGSKSFKDDIPYMAECKGSILLQYEGVEIDPSATSISEYLTCSSAKTLYDEKDGYMVEFTASDEFIFKWLVARGGGGVQLRPTGVCSVNFLHDGVVTDWWRRTYVDGQYQDSSSLK